MSDRRVVVIATTGQEILALFRALHDEGHTIMIVTHDHDVAAQCRRIISLKDGRVVADQVTA